MDFWKSGITFLKIWLFQKCSSDSIIGIFMCIFVWLIFSNLSDVTVKVVLMKKLMLHAYSCQNNSPNVVQNIIPAAPAQVSLLVKYGYLLLFVLLCIIVWTQINCFYFYCHSDISFVASKVSLQIFILNYTI